MRALVPSLVADSKFKTARYTVIANGGPLTADTAGSNFDMVLGVYSFDGFGYEQVACVVGYSLQAAATFDTVKGMTYYIQVYGFGGQYGLAKMSVD